MRPIPVTVILILCCNMANADYPVDPGLAYQKAIEYYDAGDFETALKWLTEVSDKQRAIMSLYDIAMTHFQLGNCSIARTFYRRFLHRAIASGRMAQDWWRGDPDRERYLRFEQKLVDCLADRLTGQTGSGLDIGLTYWPTPGLW